ncbi:MAG: LysM peptidoglycan-binding domain-containing protein [bacterium]|nr:LysM peptidoglycan-binding domain-containing protein [bacterium]
MSEAVQKKWDDSLISMGLGALVVVVSGILLFNYFNNQTPKFTNINTIGSNSQTTQNTPVGKDLKKIEVATSSPTMTQITQASLKPTTTATALVTSSPKPTSTVVATNKPTLAPKVSPTATASSIVTSNNTFAKPASTSAELITKHTVATGDSLWSISQKYYGSGYEWKKLASANRITKPGIISLGASLDIPRNEMISATSTVKLEGEKVSQANNSPIPKIDSMNDSTATASAQLSSSYTVTRGETLWSIAKDKCNNPYAWSIIASQNNLSKPGVVHAGNVLNIKCI